MVVHCHAAPGSQPACPAGGSKAARARWTVERPARRTGATRRGPRPPGSIVRGTRTGPPGRPRPGAGCEPVWAPAVTSNRGWNARRAKDKGPRWFVNRRQKITPIAGANSGVCQFFSCASVLETGRHPGRNSAPSLIIPRAGPLQQRRYLPPLPRHRRGCTACRACRPVWYRPQHEPGCNKAGAPVANGLGGDMAVRCSLRGQGSLRCRKPPPWIGPQAPSLAK